MRGKAIGLGGLGNPVTGDDDYVKVKIAIAEVSEFGYLKF